MRRLIVDAATQILLDEGIDQVSIRRIAERIEYSPGTIYLYFTSKEHLLVSLFEDRVERLLAYIQGELPKRPSAKERLQGVLEMQLGLLEGERELAEVLTVILRQSTKLMKEYAVPRFLAYLDAIAKIVEAGQASGEFRPDVSPHLVARAVFGALDGITLTWALGRAEPGALARASTQLGLILLSGLEPRPSLQGAT
jgi:TetR/AcrR family fatty acid metabolism transcriptional regulator